MGQATHLSTALASSIDFGSFSASQSASVDSMDYVLGSLQDVEAMALNGFNAVIFYAMEKLRAGEKR